MNPSVSIVIPNLNGRSMLETCLDSLWRLEYKDFEVIVVDNGSVDESLAYLDSLTEPRLEVVRLPGNLGFAGGCNAGIRRARGRYIATLNNDTEVDAGWAGALVGTMDREPQAGMAASKILFAKERRRIDKVGHLIYMDGLNHGRGSGEVDRGQFEIAEEVLFPDGAAALYRSEMLDQIGLFDERFFAYGDDADLGLRGRIAGWGSLYVPEARVYHLRSATAGEFSPLKAFLIERNRVWVLLKLFPLPLLLASPVFTLLRFGFHAFGALFSLGSSGRFAAGSSRTELALMIVRAQWSALRQVAPMLRSRREIRRFARLSSGEFARLLWRHRITLRALTLGT